MRLIKQHDDDKAAEEAMRGGAIGALKYSAVALFVGGVLNSTWPKFRAVRPPQKGWMMVAVSLAGFGNGSDTAFTNFERRDREMQIRVANQKRHDILYGNSEQQQAAAASLSASTLATPASPSSSPSPSPSSSSLPSASSSSSGQPAETVEPPSTKEAAAVTPESP
ncbi:hypothetical protein EDD11_000778 [Mortierella claussenii]|nr:hypothetical protein EDD11_000778 [Mortierella claussenii]